MSAETIGSARTRRVRTAIVGGGAIAKAHAVGLRAVASYFGDERLDAEVAVLVDMDADAAAASADRLGVPRWTTDLDAVLSDDAIDAVTIATPNDTHEPLAVAAVEAGKSVLCEKPLAHTIESGRTMVEAAARTGAVNLVNFNYRRLPALAHLRRLIESGELGEITGFRGLFLQDWALDANIPGSWKFRRERAGGGPVHAVGCHVIDLALHLVGDVAEVVGLTAIHHRARPAMTGRSTFAPADHAQGPDVEVDTDDVASALLRFSGGAIGTLSTSRTTPGYKNHCHLEVDGTRGSAIFDYERMNELQVCTPSRSPDGFARVVMGPGQDGGTFWASAGLGTGFAESMALQMRDLVRGATGVGVSDDAPTFADGLRAQQVAAAVLASADSGVWTAPVG
jgi:predicted dehydrogenase